MLFRICKKKKKKKKEIRWNKHQGLYRVRKKKNLLKYYQGRSPKILISRKNIEYYEANIKYYGAEKKKHLNFSFRILKYHTNFK